MYKPRKIAALKTRDAGGWRWKKYYITFDPAVYDQALVAASDESLDHLLASDSMPAEHRVGFSIIHSGFDMDFILHGYWMNGNELALKVFKAAPGQAGQLVCSDNNGSSLACVWDLAVINHERQAWIDKVLLPETPDVDAYLNHTISGYF